MTILTVVPTRFDVRSARETDVLGIARVHVASWKRAYAGLMPADVLDGLDPAQRSEEWRQELRVGGGDAVVAVREGEIVGFAYFSRSRDEDAGESVGEVQALYVHPASWRRGLGRALLAESLSRLRRLGFERATLWVLEANASACRFYDAMGLARDGARKTHPPTGLVEVRYGTALPPTR